VIPGMWKTGLLSVKFVDGPPRGKTTSSLDEGPMDFHVEFGQQIGQPG